MCFQIMSFLVLLFFYGVYFGKMLCQKFKGIQTNQIAKGKTNKKKYRIEFVMRLATFSIVAIQIISILLDASMLPAALRWCGLGLAVLGDVIFAAAVWTMRDSWRAGIPAEDKTSIVTNGIYAYSRNPAFLGFDFMYLGILLLFFNWIHLFFAVWAVLMLHLQILEEEKFLPVVFGQNYLAYQKKVHRYLGKK